MRFLLCAVVTAAHAIAWQPPPGHVEIPIWPFEAPDAPTGPGPEETTAAVKDSPVAGKPWTEVRDVSRPTMTVFPPTGKNTGAAVVVFPGGGYKVLAIDLEGTEVCDWFAAHGITCALLKYRVPDSGPHWDAERKREAVPEIPAALQDAQRTISLVRSHAADWHVDPKKIGVLGFSAGGHLVAAASTHFVERSYRPRDAVDNESCRPDFAAAIYPGHLWVEPKPLALNPDIRPAKDTPPTFLLQAEDDPVDDVQHSLTYFAALKKAKVPVELHIYAQGKHAFGLRRTGLPITRWPELVEAWLRTIGILSER